MQAVPGIPAMTQYAVFTVFSVHTVSVLMYAQCIWKSENNFENLSLAVCLVKGLSCFLQGTAG